MDSPRISVRGLFVLTFNVQEQICAILRNMNRFLALLFFILLASSAQAQSQTGMYYFGWDVRLPEHKKEGRVIKARTLTITSPAVSLELKADGTYTLKEHKQIKSGRYTIKGDNLYLVLPNTTTRPRSVFKGSDIVQDRKSWRKAGYEGWAGQNERFVKQIVKAEETKPTPNPTATPVPKPSP